MTGCDSLLSYLFVVVFFIKNNRLLLLVRNKHVYKILKGMTLEGTLTKLKTAEELRCLSL